MAEKKENNKDSQKGQGTHKKIKRKVIHKLSNVKPKATKHDLNWYYHLKQIFTRLISPFVSSIPVVLKQGYSKYFSTIQNKETKQLSSATTNTIVFSLI